MFDNIIKGNAADKHYIGYIYSKVHFKTYPHKTFVINNNKLSIAK